MTNPQKRKGDRAELEAADILHDLGGWPVRRKLGAGRTDDTGDLDGIPECVIQVKWHPSNTLAAIVAARDGVEEQARNAQVPFRAGMVRHKGGSWTVCMTPEAFVTLLREALI